MHDFQEQCQVHVRAWLVENKLCWVRYAFVVNFFKEVYNKTIMRFSFCDLKYALLVLSAEAEGWFSASADNT